MEKTVKSCQIRVITFLFLWFEKHVGEVKKNYVKLHDQALYKPSVGKWVKFNEYKCVDSKFIY